jgi:hypothetical protein
MTQNKVTQLINDLKEKHGVDLHDLYFALKKNLLQGHIMVFTQEGNPIMLPENSTCLDFAYKIDPIMGDNAESAIVNGEEVALSSVLNNEDTVKIVQSKEAKTPSHEWLNFAKTEAAINRIKASLKHECIEEKRKMGLDLLQKEYDRLGIGDIEDYTEEQLDFLKEHWHDLNIQNFNDVFVAVAEGIIAPIDVINVIFNKSKLAKTIPIKRPRKEDFKNMKDLEKAKIRLLCEFDADAVKVLESIYKSNTMLIYAYCYFSIVRQMTVFNFELAFQTYQQMLDLIKTFEHIKGVVKVERDFLRKKIIFFSYTAISFLAAILNPIILSYFPETWGFNAESDFVVSKILMYGGFMSLIFMLLMIRIKIGFLSVKMPPGKAQLIIAYPLVIFTALSLVHALAKMNDGLVTMLTILAILGAGFLLYQRHARYLKHRRLAKPKED